MPILRKQKLYNDLERVLYDEEQIRHRIHEMAVQIEQDYADKPLTIVAVMQGGALFMADLIRQINLPMKIDSISVASYHGGTESSGTVTFHQTRLPDIDGRHVLVLDDILDTGRTLHAIRQRLESDCSPLSVNSCVLLSKKIDRAEDVEADYFGFEIGNEFVVGYGLDFDGVYRNLPLIGVLRPSVFAS